MEQRKGFGNNRLFSISLIGVAALALASYYRSTSKPADYHAYWVDYEVPQGWEKVEKTGMMLFIYENPKTKAVMKGVITHGLPGEIDGNRYDSHEVADYLIKGSSGSEGHQMKLIGDFNKGEERFTLVRRDQKSKSILNAFACKGVTTLTIEVSLAGPAAKDVEKHMADLETVMKTMTWIQQPLPDKNAKTVEAFGGPPPEEYLKKHRAKA